MPQSQLPGRAARSQAAGVTSWQATQRLEASLKNAAAIAATPGIDFVLIGTGDLAISLGGFPNVDARHEEACKTVFDACKAANVPCGIFTMSAEAAAKRRAELKRMVPGSRCS